MRLLLLAFTSLLATTLALPNTTTILSSSNCNYVDSTDTIDCSAVTSVDEILAAMGELGAAGQTEITGFLLVGNPHVTHLQQDMLGEIQFKQITITDNPYLTSCGDILGASKNSVLHLDLSRNKLSYLPRMESSSLTTYKQNGAYLSQVAKSALNAVPNLQVIELQETGYSTAAGLLIFDGAFMHLPNLKELKMNVFKAKDYLITKGSFTFNSSYLHTVDLRGSPLSKAEVGTFGGFNANTTLYLYLHRIIEIESFYNVFNSGAHVVVTDPGPCNYCNLDWLRFSCLLPQVSMKCVYLYGEYWDFADIPAQAFSQCCFAPKST